MTTKTTPNLFSIATKELSQDGFYTWLIQWADISFKEVDAALNKTACAFIRMLVGLHETFNINTVDAERQWNHIDIHAEINQEYVLVIEDKTNTSEHSEQLERYKDIVVNHYKDTDKKFVFIYLKTGNESNADLAKVTKKKYKVISRKEILDILSHSESTNNILIEYIKYLQVLEDKTNACNTIREINENGLAAQGFFKEIEQIVGEWCDWKYVSNPSGGFWGLWFHWVELTNEDCQLYIQIENYINKGINLVIKVSDWIPNTNKLRQLLSLIQTKATDFDLSIEKPNRLRSGEFSTVAVVKNVFDNTEKDAVFDKSYLVEKLNSVKQLLNSLEN